MNKLSKEEFWDKLYEKFPGEIEHFRSWIDEYKKQINWLDLFPITERNNYWMDIKFHHLPDAMQFGIFLQYVVETEQGAFYMEFENGTRFEKIPEIITDYFLYLHDFVIVDKINEKYVDEIPAEPIE